MSFFKSDIVQSEMREISELQEEIYSNMFKFSSMNKSEKVRHVELLEQLLNKQKVLYTRLSLSDDPEAKMMKERITDSASLMGLPSDIDMNVLFKNMSSLLENMKQQIDKTGSDQ